MRSRASERRLRPETLEYCRRDRQRSVVSERPLRQDDFGMQGFERSPGNLRSPARAGPCAREAMESNQTGVAWNGPFGGGAWKRARGRESGVET